MKFKKKKKSLVPDLQNTIHFNPFLCKTTVENNQKINFYLWSMGLSEDF